MYVPACHFDITYHGMSTLKLTKLKKPEKWPKSIWELYPNHMHIFRPCLKKAHAKFQTSVLSIYCDHMFNVSLNYNERSEPPASGEWSLYYYRYHELLRNLSVHCNWFSKFLLSSLSHCRTWYQTNASSIVSYKLVICFTKIVRRRKRKVLEARTKWQAQFEINYVPQERALHKKSKSIPNF